MKKIYLLEYLHKQRKNIFPMMKNTTYLNTYSTEKINIFPMMKNTTYLNTYSTEKINIFPMMKNITSPTNKLWPTRQPQQNCKKQNFVRQNSVCDGKVTTAKNCKDVLTSLYPLYSFPFRDATNWMREHSTF